jgi:hypothetical protein
MSGVGASKTVAIDVDSVLADIMLASIVYVLQITF